MQKFDNVDDYIASFPKSIQEVLNKIRTTIKNVSPEAIESMSYGMPGYKLSGKPLVYFGAFKHHVGFFPTPNGISNFEKELSIYKTSKGTAQFPLDKPLPLSLIKKIVEFRVKETETRKK